jgi:hypothetical protein
VDSSHQTAAGYGDTRTASQRVGHPVSERDASMSRKRPPWSRPFAIGVVVVALFGTALCTWLTHLRFRFNVQQVLDATLFLLLLLGNLLALPIWWWLFGRPFVRLWCWFRSGPDPQRHASNGEGGQHSVKTHTLVSIT